MKIVRDEERLGASGLPRSRGFGFLHFESHEHALAALNAMGDNSRLLQERRLLIVEFAVDNVQKLKVHENREKLGAGKGVGKGKGGGKGGGKGSGKGGGANEDGVEGGKGGKGRGVGKGGGKSEGPGKGSEEAADDAGAETASPTKHVSRGARQRAQKREGGQDAGEGPDDGDAKGRRAAAAIASLSAMGAAGAMGAKRKRAFAANVDLPAGSAAFSAPVRAARGGAADPATKRKSSDRPDALERQGGKPAKRQRSAAAEALQAELDSVLPASGMQVKKRGKQQRPDRGEARFESLVSQYKRQIGAADGFAAQLKEWM